MLDNYLACALGIQSTCLSLIDEENYILTLDYTIKMITIHERHECGVPVIIRGETGVGKTALVNMLSRLWHQSLLHRWQREKDQLLEIIRQMPTAVQSHDSYQACIQTLQNMTERKEVTEEELVAIISLLDASSSTGTFHSKLREHMLKMADDPARALLYLPQGKKDQVEEYGVEEEESGREKLQNAFDKAKDEDTVEVCNCYD